MMPVLSMFARSTGELDRMTMDQFVESILQRSREMVRQVLESLSP